MLNDSQIQIFMSFLHNLFQINITHVQSPEDIASFEKKILHYSQSSTYVPDEKSELPAHCGLTEHIL